MAADDRTFAESLTSAGRRLRVSFRLAAPPASSFLYYDYAGAAHGIEEVVELEVVAAHGGSILLRMMHGLKDSSSTMVLGQFVVDVPKYEHFVYRAGAAGKFPQKYMEEEARRDPDYCRVLLNHDTGVLRRGDGDLLVAQLELGNYGRRDDMADLCVLHLGRSDWEWELKRAVPILHEGGGGELLGSVTAPDPDIAIPVGDRFLCWVRYNRVFILCDMVDEASPRLQYVPLPVMPYDPGYYTDDLVPLTDPQNMGAAGDRAVRLVAIEPRCCCGGFGRSTCLRSRHAFTVTTWTLDLTMDKPMAWVKDGVLDCEELWALPGYEGLPRVYLQSPVASLDNPDVVCFKLLGEGEWRKGWMIQVDTRRKALLAVVQ